MTVATSAAPHLFWITSRAAGIVSLVVASLAVSVGLMMSLRMLRARRPELLALHEVLSLATLVALAVHGLALLGDGVLSPSLGDIAVPFAWSYKTAWTSIGIIGGWALVILGLSYYARQAIGSSRWRKLHRLTALAWIAGIVHTLGEGTDAGQIWFLAMLAIVAIPAIALLAVRHLTDDAPRPAQGTNAEAREGLEPRRVADHEARELPAAPRPAGTALR
jgi:methionine sulfoxide reductase heme-binding subunit